MVPDWYSSHRSRYSLEKESNGEKSCHLVLMPLITVALTLGVTFGLNVTDDLPN